MEEVRRIAIACIGRAVLFGALAIACVMLSLSFHPVAAFRSGAVLTLIMSAILLAKAMAAPLQNPRNTEVWMYLDKRFRPVNEFARDIFGKTLREVYVQYCWISLAVACGFFVLSIILAALGVESTYTPGQGR